MQGVHDSSPFIFLPPVINNNRKLLLKTKVYIFSKISFQRVSYFIYLEFFSNNNFFSIHIMSTIACCRAARVIIIYLNYTVWLLIDWIEFYTVSTIFQPCNGDTFGIYVPRILSLTKRNWFSIKCNKENNFI